MGRDGKIAIPPGRNSCFQSLSGFLITGILYDARDRTYYFLPRNSTGIRRFQNTAAALVH